MREINAAKPRFLAVPGEILVLALMTPAEDTPKFQKK